MKLAGVVARLISVVLILRVNSVRGDSQTTAAHSVPLFTIGKSQNKNQVQYAVHVDDHCVPVPGAPVYAYWHMLELGPTRVAPLLSREFRAYGIASQRVTTHETAGGKIRLVLRALPSRPILVETVLAPNGACRALATVAIAGNPAHLFDVYVKLTWLLGLDYLLLRGWSMDGTQIVKERLGA
jgi:hypothetical protein